MMIPSSRPMPRHAARYLASQARQALRSPSEPVGPRELRFGSLLLDRKTRTPRWIRSLTLPLVYAILLYCCVADELSLHLEQLRFRTIDRYATRLSQIVLTGASLLLCMWILDAILSGAFARTVR